MWLIRIVLSFILLITTICLPHTSIAVSSHPVAIGWASFYGEGFHGNKTSSGKRFNMYDIKNAAHPTLPFGTIALVTNLENGKSVEVVIYDRGPFSDEWRNVSREKVEYVKRKTRKPVTVTGKRSIDLSYAAAQELDMVRKGVVPVSIEVVGMLEQYARR